MIVNEKGLNKNIMTQYNLINTGAIISNTASGTGNISLTIEELYSLYDGNITSSGVSLTTLDILYIDIDMGYRVRVDDIKLFIDVNGDRATALNNVDFYYKNSSVDAFVLCGKTYNATTFYPINLPDIFAPIEIRIIINSIECDIYEMQVMNDDTQVSFGVDGTDSVLNLNQVTGGYDTLSIFNNSVLGTNPVTAYVIVDPKGYDSDFYIKLASTSDGTYYSLNDGVSLYNNDLSNKFIWNKGIFYNTEIDIYGNLITDNFLPGNYTTPILFVNDVFESSFLISDKTLIGEGLITWDESIPQGTVKIKSSDIEPLPFNKLYFAYKNNSGDSDFKIFEGDMNNGIGDEQKLNATISNYRHLKKVIFDRYRSQYILMARFSYYSINYTLYKYDYNTNELLYSSSSFIDYNIQDTMGVDIAGNVWGYSTNNSFNLRCFTYDLSSNISIKEDEQSNFLTDLSVNKLYASCWYTEQSQNKIIHVLYNGVIIASFGVTSPTYICSLLDGGCFVVKSVESKVVRYTYHGVEVSSFVYDTSFDINGISYGIYCDSTSYNKERLWVYTNNLYVIQFDFSGNIISNTFIADIDSIEAFPGGCLVYADYITYQLNNEGQIANTWDFSSYENVGLIPFPVTIEYDEFLDMHGVGNILPLATDIVWGSDNGWSEVVMSGYKLPFRKYHQIKYQLIPGTNVLNIVNSGAEIGDLTGWVSGPDTAFTVVSGGYSGNYHFETEYYGTGWLTQKLNLVSLGVDTTLFGNKNNTAYVYIDCMFKGSNLTTHIYGKVGVNYYDSLDTFISSDYGDAYYYDNNQWELIILHSLIPINTMFIKVILKHSSNSTSCVNSFDDVNAIIYIKPSLNSVIIPKPVKINDIQPQSYKDVYIKTEFPVEADYQEYETKLKCWWGNEEI